ncbi:MAG TPA: RDD family protein [Opitutaceae bacterium]|nr:RDD family protein [Opitutaceae bacterium]
MFTIIGGDGKEYGPVTTEQVRAWITSGRASLDTKAKATGSDEWRRLADFSEFGGAIILPPLIGRAAEIAGGGALAGHGARIGAALLNAFLYFLGVLPGSIKLTGHLLKQNPDMTQRGIPNLSQLDLTGVGPFIAYAWAGILTVVVIQLILLTLRGQNLGKLVFGARVVLASDGSPAGFFRAGLLRFLLPVMLIFILNHVHILLGALFLFVDLCFMFGEPRRCLHDLVAGTKVVKT